GSVTGVPVGVVIAIEKPLRPALLKTSQRLSSAGTLIVRLPVSDEVITITPKRAALGPSGGAFADRSSVPLVCVTVRRLAIASSRIWITDALRFVPQVLLSPPIPMRMAPRVEV